jgi:hypothetical protein
MTRDERIRDLRAAGVPLRQIAEQERCSVSTVNRAVNPAYAEQNRQGSKAAKARRTGTCADCGAVTRYNGRTTRGASVRCLTCAARHSGQAKKRWTQDVIAAKIQQWNRIYGNPPKMLDWNPHRLDGHRLLRFQTGDWPGFTSVVRAYGSWNNAIQSAGLEPRKPGRQPKRTSSYAG